MSRTSSKDLKKVEPKTSFLARYADDTSLDDMTQYVILPFLKVIQSMTDASLKKTCGEGSVIVRPGDAIVWKEGADPFDFVAQFFFVEYSKFSDRKDKESPVVIERTYDPASEIAKKALDKDRRFETYEGHENKPENDQWKYRYVRHFRFAGVIYGEHELAGTPVVLTFDRGEDYQGQSFISAMKMRKQRTTVGDETKVIPIPLWAQVWSFKASLRDLGDRKWYGLDFVPGIPALIDPKDAEMMTEAHVELKKLHEKNRLVVDDKEVMEDEAAVTASDPY